ncbi:MAG: glycosyltransferase family 2 protein [Verrucomicrobia bacterium]|nr:glycosyltransferase family 2 protein [Verrucomicrobiota bacterium]
MLTATETNPENVHHSPLTTPVAFLVFNRPEVTQRVFSRIAEVKPKTLLVVADGPRTKEETKACDTVRKIIDQVDWDCRVLKNFSDVNLGCKYRVASGLDWVFSQVSEAIILEDDCLPSRSFFYFCQTLLDYYRHDERIFMIGGDNFQSGVSRAEGGYYFSRYAEVWGWATWRRAWRHYDVTMKSWPGFKAAGRIRWVFENSVEQAYWEPYFQQCYDGKIDTWDYIWFYTCLSQSGLTILPDTNLVSNIGFGPNATHTFNVHSRFANAPTGDIWHLKHPQHMIRHAEADAYFFEQVLKD